MSYDFRSRSVGFNVFVRFHSQDAVHDLVPIQVLDGRPRRFGVVILHDSSGEASAEVVLLDEALLQRSLSSEKFLP